MGSKLMHECDSVLSIKVQYLGYVLNNYIDNLIIVFLSIKDLQKQIIDSFLPVKKMLAAVRRKEGWLTVEKRVNF